MLDKLKCYMKHIPLLFTVCGSCYAAVISVNTTITNGLNSVRSEWVSDAREPTYDFIYSQIKKQKEKLEKDPDDIKTADVEFLFNQCNSDFGRYYIESLPPAEKAGTKKICAQLESQYISRTRF
jgi:hypothetical protein